MNRKAADTFLESGLAFKDIIWNGKAGGYKALQSYLKMRRRMTGRQLEAPLDQDTQRLVEQQIKAFDAALAVCPKMRSPQNPGDSAKRGAVK